jgi:hypothetical protein
MDYLSYRAYRNITIQRSNCVYGSPGILFVYVDLAMWFLCDGNCRLDVSKSSDSGQNISCSFLFPFHEHRGSPGFQAIFAKQTIGVMGEGVQTENTKIPR